jgi:hypothetical protein
VPTRIVLEGPALEPLLTQVRDEYGGRATIVSANKVRTGGLGGFFAKERFELSVELSDDDIETTDPAASLLDLVDSREDRFEGHQPEPVPTVAPVRGGDSAVTPLAIPVLPASVEVRTPAMAATGTVPPRASVVSTTGAAFADVMAGLHNDLAKARQASPARPAPTVANGRRAYQGPALPEQPLVADLRALGFPAELAAKATGPDPYRAVLTALVDLPEPPVLPSRPGDLFLIIGELTMAVRTAEWAARTLRLDPAQVLLAGPSTAGTPIHASRRITGPADAERRAHKIERSDTPSIVIVDAPLGVDVAWAEGVVGALDATASWATVDATRKPGDTATHLRTLGKVDGLAVYHAEISADPGTVLALPAPVALLDGAPAGAHEWAALLSRRLSARRAAPAGTDREAPWH